MRIANLLLGSGNDAHPGLQVPGPLIAPGIEVELVETGVYAEPRDPATATLLAAGVAASAVRAERDGYDAAFINTTADYGLAEARALVAMPVVGAGESAARLAASLGGRFAIVQVWPSWSRWIDERMLRDAALIDRCCAIRHVTSAGEEDDVHAAMIVGRSGVRERMLARISEQVEAAVTEDGAEVVVLGCTCMSAVSEELARRTDVPVVDPLRAGYLAAEQLARMGLTNGTRHSAGSKGGLESLFERLADVVGADDAFGGNQVASCAVCAPIYADVD